MNLKVQRFQPGHPLYCSSSVMHDGKAYRPVFGRMINPDTNEFLCYTMERYDTLIPEGTYNISYYNSPTNKAIVPLLHDVKGFEFIEMHIANYPYEIKGCTAVGLGINIEVPMLISSGKAFMNLMNKLNMETAKVTYEKLEPLA